MRCSASRWQVALAVAIGCIAFPPASLLAQKILPEGIKDLATQIATNVAKEQKHKIAVLPFRELDGHATVLGTYISEELVTDLFTIGGLEIVERTMLDKIVGELKLGQTGVIDPETAKQVGKIAGVDAIVTGSITDLQSYVALNCRLIDAQTGRIFAAAQTKIVKDDDVRKIMGAPLPMPAPTGGAPGQPSVAPISGSRTSQQTATKRSQQQEINGFLFELKKCTLRGSSVECDLLITNNKEDRKIQIVSTIGYGFGPSRLIDTDGNEYVGAKEAFLGSDRGGAPQSVLASGIPTRARLTFENVSPDIELARLVEISWLLYPEGFKAQFRNVPLVRP